MGRAPASLVNIRSLMVHFVLFSQAGRGLKVNWDSSPTLLELQVKISQVRLHIVE